MQIESRFGHASELGQSHFGNAPEVFNAVDVRRFCSEFIFSMLHSVMLFVTQVHQAVVTAPPVGMDGAFEIHLTPDHRL